MREHRSDMVRGTIGQGRDDAIDGPIRIQKGALHARVWRWRGKERPFPGTTAISVSGVTIGHRVGLTGMTLPPYISIPRGVFANFLWGIGCVPRVVLRRGQLTRPK